MAFNTNKRYRSRYTEKVNKDGVEYLIRSEDGCFYDIFLNETLIAQEYTKRQHAVDAIMNEWVSL